MVEARFKNIALYLTFCRYIRSILRFPEEDADVRKDFALSEFCFFRPAFFRYYATFSLLISSKPPSIFTRNKTFCEHRGLLRVFCTVRLYSNSSFSVKWYPFTFYKAFVLRKAFCKFVRSSFEFFGTMRLLVERKQAGIGPIWRHI